MPNLAPPSDVVFRAVWFVSGSLVELHLAKGTVKFQLPALFGGGSGESKFVQNAFLHFQIVQRPRPNSQYGLHFYGVFYCVL